MAKVEKRIVKTLSIKTENFRGSAGNGLIRCRMITDSATQKASILIPVELADELIDFLKTSKKEASDG